MQITTVHVELYYNVLYLNYICIMLFYVILYTIIWVLWFKLRFFNSLLSIWNLYYYVIFVVNCESPFSCCSEFFFFLWKKFFFSFSFSPHCFSENEIKCLLWKDGRSYERSYRMHVRYEKYHRCEIVRNSTIHNTVLNITVCKNWKVQNIRYLII